MKNEHQNDVTADREGMLIAKAYHRAGDSLGLTQSQLAEIVGLSRSQMSRVANGEAPVSGKQRELAEYLIRVFRSVDAMTGGNSTLSRDWMVSRNTNFGEDVPVKLILRAAGLVDVMNYLDAARAPI